MAFNLSNASSVLKVRYVGTVREQLNNATILLDKIEKRDQPVSGKTYTVPLHTTRNAASGIGRGDGGTLPTAGQQGYTTTVVPNAYLYSRIKVTGPTIAAARDNMGAFVRALESEVDGVVRDTKRKVNRQLHSDGTDAIAFWTDTDTSTTAALDDGQGNAFVHFTGTGTFDLVDATDHSTIIAGGDSVSWTISYNSTTGAYNVAWSSGALTGTADGDYLVEEDSLGYQMMGIRGIIDEADVPNVRGNHANGLQGLAVATNQFWKAQVVGSYSTLSQLAFEDMQNVLDKIATESDYTESDVAFGLCSHGVRRAYYKLCVAERRHVNTMELDGGWKALDFNGIGIVADPQCRKNTLYWIVPDTMAIFRSSDWDWMDMDGSYLSRVANEDAYEGVLFAYQNLACLSRNGNGILKGIIEA